MGLIKYLMGQMNCGTVQIEAYMGQIKYCVGLQSMIWTEQYMVLVKQNVLWVKKYGVDQTKYEMD